MIVVGQVATKEEFKSKYSYHVHIGCGGNLTFERRITERTKFGQLITKDLYRCDKCNALINCIICPSWRDYHPNGV